MKFIENLDEKFTSKNKIMSEENKTQTLNHIDYKDIMKLKAHVNPHARMLNRRRTGFTSRQQRDFARATKRARFMALMPFIAH